MTKPFLPAALALPLMTIAASAATAQQQPPLPAVTPGATILDVSAEGRVSRVPDLATIRAGVVTQAPSAAAALADNAARMARVVAALKAAGIADRDIATASVSLSPQYRDGDNQPPVITGYQASNSVSVRFREVARAGKALDTLVAQGANQIDGPTLSLSNPDAALDEARTDAVARAKARADLYARAAGMQVVRVVSIAEAGEDAGTSPSPVMFRLRAQAAAPSTAVLPGETDVTARLSVRFELR